MFHAHRCISIHAADFKMNVMLSKRFEMLKLGLFSMHDTCLIISEDLNTDQQI